MDECIVGAAKRANATIWCVRSRYRLRVRLANELSRTGIGLKAGQTVSTGTLTGMLRPKPGETYVADFGPFGSVTASYV